MRRPIALALLAGCWLAYATTCIISGVWRGCIPARRASPERHHGMRRHRRSRPFDGSSAARTPPSPNASSGTPRAFVQRSISPDTPAREGWRRDHPSLRRQGARNRRRDDRRSRPVARLAGNGSRNGRVCRRRRSVEPPVGARTHRPAMDTTCLRERPADYRLAPGRRVPRRPGRRNMQRTSGIVETTG
jgi:hypothetical protein